MKWLFLLMVVVNIGIFVWGLQRDTGTETALDPRYRNIGQIKLLTKADLGSSATVQVFNKENTGEPFTSTEPQIGNKDNVATTTRNGLEVEIKSEDELRGEREVEVVDGKDSVEKDAKIPELETPPKVSLAAEKDHSSQTGVEESAAVEAKTVNEKESFCWTLGPITERSAALNILSVVEKKVAFADIREDTEKKITGFWVVLPPYENARAANEVVKQLKAKDVLDVQRFYKGEFQNGVSLGIYNQRFNAEKRRAQIETKGFFPEVLPRYKEVSRYWVDYRAENAVDVPADMPSEYRDLAVAQRECDAALN